MAGELTSRLSKFILESVEITTNVLGSGSYASVLELNYNGLKCAGKKIHEVILSQDSKIYITSRFVEEIHLLSQIRHPNIVQFLGVCFQSDSQIPILVMEFIPTDLTSCVHQYGILPETIMFSIVHDVSLGLVYLHGHNPSIIHRDLSSNNILLTENMAAKISDLGVAKLFNTSPAEVNQMTQIPGTPAFMPPEVMVADPKYNASVDIFSFGIMMIHLLCGSWPEPQLAPNKTEDGKLISISEAERRKNLLSLVDDKHPLMSLVLMCIDNDPNFRPQANEVENRLAELTAKFPVKFPYRFDIIKHVRSLTNEIEELKSQIKQLKEQLSTDSELVTSAIETLTKVQKRRTTKKQTKEIVEVLTKSSSRGKAVFTILNEESAQKLKTEQNRSARKLKSDQKLQDIHNEQQVL